MSSPFTDVAMTSEALTQDEQQQSAAVDAIPEEPPLFASLPPEAHSTPKTEQAQTEDAPAANVTSQLRKSSAPSASSFSAWHKRRLFRESASIANHSMDSHRSYAR